MAFNLRYSEFLLHRSHSHSDLTELSYKQIEESKSSGTENLRKKVLESIKDKK